MDLLADLRYALRLLRKTPVFTIAAIGTLALGIGANTTIFSLVQTVLLHPLPYQDPDQVVMVWEDATFAGFPRNTPAPGNFNDWRASNRSFTDMAATRFAGASLTMDGPPELVLGRGVTPNFFDVLGVRPLLGRSFTPADDRAGVQRRGHQPRAVAAALRRRPRHHRPDDADERRQVRGDRRRSGVVRVHQSRGRLLGSHAASAGPGRYPPLALPERRGPPEARRVRASRRWRDARHGETHGRAVPGHEPRRRCRSRPDARAGARRHEGRSDRAGDRGRRPSS